MVKGFNFLFPCIVQAPLDAMMKESFGCQPVCMRCVFPVVREKGRTVWRSHGRRRKSAPACAVLISVFIYFLAFLAWQVVRLRLLWVHFVPSPSVLHLRLDQLVSSANTSSLSGFPDVVTLLISHL